MSDLTHPAGVLSRLSEIENDLAIRQNAYESAAGKWVRAMRNQKKARATAFLRAKETTSVVAERTAIADAETALDGVEEEAEYVALKAVVSTLSERATIGMAILKAQGRP